VPAAPLLVLTAFVAGALMLFPGSLLIGATVIVHGWPRGALYAWTGCLLSAAVSYMLGRLLPRSTVQRRWGRQSMWLRGQLRRRGMLAVVMARLLPVGSFSALNMVAGSLEVPFGWFMLANAVGLLPGIVAMALLADRAAWAARDPGPTNLVLLFLLLAATGAVLWWVGRRLGRSATPALPARVLEP
jgi:phospholipase D1/2